MRRPALEELCRAYRPPVLAYIRRNGQSGHDTEDLAQAFFLRFLERVWYAQAAPQRGRFRALLLTSLPDGRACARRSMGLDPAIFFRESQLGSELWYQHDRLLRHNYGLAGIGGTWRFNDVWSISGSTSRRSGATASTTSNMPAKCRPRGVSEVAFMPRGAALAPSPAAGAE